VRIGSRRGNPSFDWNDDATWSKCLEGIAAVYITYQPDLAVPGAREAVKKFAEMAVSRGIEKLVLLSGRGEKEAQLCEEEVKTAGAAWTIVRASWFQQNFSEGFFLDPILAGHVSLPNADTLVPFIDVNDIADVVVEALLKEKHNGRTYELTGPSKMTFREAVAAIATASGKEITFESITLDAYEEILRKNHVPDNFIWLIRYLFSEVLIEENSNVTKDVETILGRPAKNFEAYAREGASTGVWDHAAVGS